jgi:hypothetical protein
VLGSAAFKPVKNDMVGNIKVSSYVEYVSQTHKLIRAENPRTPTRRPRPLRNPPRSRPQRAQGEETHRHRRSRLAEPVHSPYPFLHNNLLTILRSALDFTAQALRHNISNPNKELADSFRDAYGNTLKPHHSFIVKPIFSAAMSATPYRKDFYKKLGDDDAKVQAELEKWLKGLEQDIAIMNGFLARKEAKW